MEGVEYNQVFEFSFSLVGGVMLTFSGGENVSIAHTEFIFSNDNDFWIN